MKKRKVIRICTYITAFVGLSASIAGCQITKDQMQTAIIKYMRSQEYADACAKHNAQLKKLEQAMSESKDAQETIALSKEYAQLQDKLNSQEFVVENLKKSSLGKEYKTAQGLNIGLCMPLVGICAMAEGAALIKIKEDDEM